jgi:hypothetical protein
MQSAHEDHNALPPANLQTTTTAVDELPRDIWSEVIDFLPLSNLPSVLCLSRTLAKIVDHEDVFERLCRSTYPPATLDVDAYGGSWKAMLRSDNAINGLRVRSLPTRAVHRRVGFSSVRYRSALCWDAVRRTIRIRLVVEVNLCHDLGADGAVHMLNLSRDTLKDTAVYRYPEEGGNHAEEEATPAVEVAPEREMEGRSSPSDEEAEDDDASAGGNFRQRQRDNEGFVRMKPLATYFETVQLSLRSFRHTFLFVFDERDLVAGHHYILRHHGIFSVRPFLNSADFPPASSDECGAQLRSCRSDADDGDGETASILSRLFDLHQSRSSHHPSRVCQMIPRNGTVHTSVWQKKSRAPGEIRKMGYHWIRTGSARCWR